MTETDDDITEDEDVAGDDDADSDEASSDDIADDDGPGDEDSGAGVSDEGGEEDSGEDAVPEDDSDEDGEEDGDTDEDSGEASKESDQPGFDPFADHEEDDLSFLADDGDEDLDENEDEEVEEGRSGGRFRVGFLLVAYLVALLFFGGIIGWLLMSGEEKAMDMEADIAAFTSSLPPEMERSDPAPAVTGGAETWDDGPAGAATGPLAADMADAGDGMPGEGMAESGPGAVPSTDMGTGAGDEMAMVSGDGVKDGSNGEILSPARLLPRAFLEKKMAQLAPSPDPELVEEATDGLLPKISDDGRMSFRVYARPFDLNDKRPRIAIIIQNMGLSHSATETAIQQLPGSVTLAFSPYAGNLDHWTAEARKVGHEILLALPMEPVNYPLNDPGPYALITGLAPEQNVQRLQWLLSRFTGYVGVTNEMGSRFITSNQDMKPVMEIFNNRGLMFLDNRVTNRSVAIRVAEEVGLPWAAGDMSIDRNPSRSYIDNKLADIQRIALEKGTAVAMALPYPVTFERLALWLPKLEEEGFAVAPISALINQQGSQEETEVSDEGEE